MCEKRDYWQSYWGKQKNLCHQAQDCKEKTLTAGIKSVNYVRLEAKIGYI